MVYKARITGHRDVPDSQRLLFDGTRVEGGDFSGRNLVQFTAVKSRFDACNFTNMTIAQACFGGGRADSTYVNCAFDRSRITASAPGRARFEHCSFRNTRFDELNCKSVEFVDCIFTGVIARGYFNGAVSADAADLGRDRNEFRGNDFSQAALLDTTFRTGIDLNQQRLPEGEEYIYVPDAEEFLRLVRAQPEGTLGTDSGKVGVVVQIMEREVARGQRQLFYNINAFPREFREALTAMRALLVRP